MTAVSRLIVVVLDHGSAFDAAVEENLHSMRSKFCVTEIRTRIPTFELCSHAVEAKTWIEPDHHVAPYRQPPGVVNGDRALVAKPPSPFVSIDGREQCGDRRKREPFDQNPGSFRLESIPRRISRLFIETRVVERHSVRDHGVAASPECDRVLGTGCVEFMTGGQPLRDQVALVPPLEWNDPGAGRSRRRCGSNRIDKLSNRAAACELDSVSVEGRMQHVIAGIEAAWQDGLAARLDRPRSESDKFIEAIRVGRHRNYRTIANRHRCPT